MHRERMSVDDSSCKSTQQKELSIVTPTLYSTIHSKFASKMHASNPNPHPYLNNRSRCSSELKLPADFRTGRKVIFEKRLSSVDILEENLKRVQEAKENIKREHSQ